MRTKRSAAYAAGIVAASLATTTMAACSVDTTGAQRADTKTTATRSAKPKIAPGTIPGNGIFQVGRDIQPGTYESAGPDDESQGMVCYWARLKSPDTDTFLANEAAPGHTVIRVRKTDKYVQTMGCQPFALVK